MKKIEIFLLFFACSICSGKNNTQNHCDSDKCYRNVNSTHENLLQLVNELNSTSLSAKITKPYSLKPYEELIKQVEQIGQKSRNIVSDLNNINNRLNQHQKNITNNEGAIDLILEKLYSLTQMIGTSRQLNGTLAEVQNKYDEVKHLVHQKQNVSKTCDQAKGNYTELENNVNTTFSDYKKIRKNYENLKNKTRKTNESLSETVRNAVKNKNDFEQLRLPYNVVEDYLNKTAANLNLSVNYLNDNLDILKNLLEASYKLLSDQIKNESNRVEESISDIQRDIKAMNEELVKYEEEIIKDNFTSTVNNESLKLISLLEKKLDILQNKLNKTDFSEKEKKLLNKEYESDGNVIRMKTEKLTNYTMLLDLIPASDKELEKIGSEITNFRISISLIEQSKELEDKLFHLRTLRDEVVKINCTETGILT